MRILTGNLPLFFRLRRSRYSDIVTLFLKWNHHQVISIRSICIIFCIKTGYQHSNFPCWYMVWNSSFQLFIKTHRILSNVESPYKQSRGIHKDHNLPAENEEKQALLKNLSDISIMHNVGWNKFLHLARFATHRGILTDALDIAVLSDKKNGLFGVRFLVLKIGITVVEIFWCNGTIRYNHSA